MVHVNPVTAVTHLELERFDALQFHKDGLGRPAPTHYAAFPEGLAVTDQLERDAAVLADFAIHTNDGAEALRLSIKDDEQFAIGVGAHTVLEFEAADGQRVAVR